MVDYFHYLASIHSEKYIQNCISEKYFSNLLIGIIQDIDDCIKNKEKNCVSNQWTYIEFFCGSEKLCAT